MGFFTAGSFSQSKELHFSLDLDQTDIKVGFSGFQVSTTDLQQIALEKMKRNGNEMENMNVVYIKCLDTFRWPVQCVPKLEILTFLSQLF